jgi:predicted alpha/beta-fold hydrolase
MLGMVKIFKKKGWDTVSVNLRGCSGEPNRQLRSYHHGATDDLYTVIEHVLALGFRKIVLVGFSLGGNMILKYLGEKQFPVPDQLICSVAISAPCDLPACARKLDQKSRSFYRNRFLKMLHKKLIEKKKVFPDNVILDGYDKIGSFNEYDDRYTAPFHGFSDAQDYYKKSGSLQFLDTIDSPVLLINAQDDPFLTPSCNPFDIAKKNSALFLDVPTNGGHVGFISFNSDNLYWHESRTFDFVEQMQH